VKIYYDPSTEKIVVDMKYISRITNDGHLFNGKYESYLPETLQKGEKMKLHVFLDRSVLDIFINDRWASSVRIFPTNETATGASFYTKGATQVDRLEAYIMGEGYAPAPEMVGVENITIEDDIDSACNKYVQDGQVLISKEGKKYTVLGMEL
jgi:beta-fructofuranosidase